MTKAMRRPSMSLQDPFSSLISLPLLKFSFAADLPEVDKFSWQHTTQNLIVVFDSFRSATGIENQTASKFMKVIQGTQILV